MRNAGAILAIAVTFAVLTSLAFVGGAGAGDSATILEVEPETAEAPPGETIRVAVQMASDGGYGGVGIERVAFGIEYDPDVLTVETVHRGPWLEQGNETEVVVDADVDEEDGYASIDQTRDPAAGGATGNARIATVTFRVAEGADGAESPAGLTDVESDLTNGWPMQSFTHNGTVSVSEDAAVVDAAPPDGPVVFDGADETADGDTGDRSDDGDEGAIDAISGFGVAAALVALLAGGWARRS